MLRLARSVFAGVAHQLTQCRNRRGQVLFPDDDRHFSRALLRSYVQKHHMDVLAWCCMTTHVHVVVVPDEARDLQRVCKPRHMQYAQQGNRLHGWKVTCGTDGVSPTHWTMCPCGPRSAPSSATQPGFRAAAYACDAKGAWSHLISRPSPAAPPAAALHTAPRGRSRRLPEGCDRKRRAKVRLICLYLCVLRTGSIGA